MRLRHSTRSFLQVVAPAQPPSESMPEVAARLLTALANAVESAKREHLEVPREAISAVFMWAMRQRCIATCSRCAAPMLGSLESPQFCSACRASLPPILRPTR